MCPLRFTMHVRELVIPRLPLGSRDVYQERGRLAAVANALLEAARKEKEEEDRKAEAAARAEEAERARERAEAGRAAEEKRHEVNALNSAGFFVKGALYVLCFSCAMFKKCHRSDYVCSVEVVGAYHFAACSLSVDDRVFSSVCTSS